MSIIEIPSRKIVKCDRCQEVVWDGRLNELGGPRPKISLWPTQENPSNLDLCEACFSVVRSAILEALSGGGVK